MSRYRSIPRAALVRCSFAVAMGVLFGTAQGALAEPPAGTEAGGTLSIGTPMRGSLKVGEVLPKKGAGYVLTRETRRRRARFGASELVALVKDAAFRVHRKHPGSTLRVGDLSARRGGRIDHHGSHQNGRDVDFLFYLFDDKGRPSSSEEFIPIDRNGFSTEPPMSYRFDTARNWALVRSLLTSRRAEVQWIFVADHLKQLLIDHALESGAPRKVIGRARQVLRQPGAKTHMDHFHVRIYCPRSDRPRCVDIGPRWAWIK